MSADVKRLVTSWFARLDQFNTETPSARHPRLEIEHHRRLVHFREAIAMKRESIEQTDEVKAILAQLELDQRDRVWTIATERLDNQWKALSIPIQLAPAVVFCILFNIFFARSTIGCFVIALSAIVNYGLHAGKWLMRAIATRRATSNVRRIVRDMATARHEAAS
jgi:hypothetical protein